MDAISSILSPTAAPAGSQTDAFNELKSGDFLRLLIAQLTAQDPMEPMGNQELLQQISTIRDIELSTNLSDSLNSLSGQQKFTSASQLIGQYVTGVAAEDGTAINGLVTAVRFDAQGRPALQLSNGGTLPLDRVAAIESPVQVAERLMGSRVTGSEPGLLGIPRGVEGIVTGVTEEEGEVILELDTGATLALKSVTGATSLSVAA